MTQRTRHIVVTCLLALLLAPVACVSQMAGEPCRPVVEAAPPEQGEAAGQTADEREDLEEINPDFYVGIDS